MVDEFVVRSDELFDLILVPAVLKRFDSLACFADPVLHFGRQRSAVDAGGDGDSFDHEVTNQANLDITLGNALVGIGVQVVVDGG